MNHVLKSVLSASGAFFGNAKKRRLLFLALLCLAALGDYLYLGLARRTFVFYSNFGGKTSVEERMFRRSHDQETDIRRYTEEVLLGPASPDSAALFPRETRLDFLMYRDFTVYAGLSEAAALPFPGGDSFRSLLTLNEGIRRNFPSVKDVRLFIGGNSVFFKEFHGIFADPADNSKTAP